MLDFGLCGQGTFVDLPSLDCRDMLATCSEDCTLGLWTLPAGSTRVRCSGSIIVLVVCMIFRPHGRRCPCLSYPVCPVFVMQAANLLSVCWVNALVTGVAFCGSGSNDLAAVAYDQDEISIWTAAAG